MTDSGPALRVRVIDPNGISIAEEQTYSIKLSCRNIELVSQEGDDILVLADATYYLMPNDPGYNNKEIIPSRISEKKNVDNVFLTNILHINGQWVFLQRKSSGQLDRIPILPFPLNPEVLAEFDNRKYLLRDEKQVYTFEVGDKKASKFPGLNAARVQCFKADNNDPKYFLTDGQLFYIVDMGMLDTMNLTQSLLSLGAARPFTIKEAASNWLNTFVDFGDGKIWSYIPAGMDLSDGSTAYLYPLEGKWLNMQHQLVSVNGKIYYGGWEAANDFPSLDVASVKVPWDLLITASGLYYDGLQYYNCNYDTKKLDPVSWLTAKATWKSGWASYRNSISPFFDDGQHLIFPGSDDGRHRVIPHVSALKELELAYVFDDKILIEDQVIPNIADRETMEFLGSTVDVINGCDGGRGQVDVVVEYNYYFKDKNAVYFYHTGTGQMKKLENLKPDMLERNNYVQMRALRS